MYKVEVTLDVPLFSGYWGERGKPRLIRTTKAIAEGAIAEEEDQYGEAAAGPVARKKWNIELHICFCNQLKISVLNQNVEL